MIVELPLSKCSHHFVVLNVGMKVFKQVQVETYNDENDNSLINAYTKRLKNMEQLTLIDVEKYWSYDKCRWGGKWLPRSNASIVRVFPRFNSIPDRKDEKFFELCWSELVLYKKLRDFRRDIGHTSNEILWNWKNLQYIPWHVDRKPMPTDARVESDDEEERPNT